MAERKVSQRAGKRLLSWSFPNSLLELNGRVIWLEWTGYLV